MSPRRKDSNRAPRPAGNLDRWAPLLLLGLVLCIFGRILGHGFVVVDDTGNLLTNPYFNASSLADCGEFWSRPFLRLYIPVTYSFWAVLAGVSHALHHTTTSSQLDPVIFHAASLVIHTLNAWLVYRILRKLAPASATGISLAGAALFALHPMQTEAVCWATGMKDLLSTAFAFGALDLWLSPRWQRDRWLPLYIAATFLFALALLAKSSVAIVPLIAGWLSFYWLRNSGKEILIDTAPWLGLAAAAVMWTLWAQSGSTLVFIPPWWERPVVALDALGFYLSKLVAPWPLLLDYARPPDSVVHGTLPAALGLLALTAVPLTLRRRSTRQAGIAIGIAALAMLPTSGLLPFDLQIDSTVTNRYFYLSMLGAALAFAWALGRLPVTRALWISAALLGGLGILTFRQAGIWKSSSSLLEQNLSFAPQSTFSLRSLAEEADARGDFPEAEHFLRRAIDLNPHQPLLSNNLGDLLAREGRLAEAARILRQTTNVYPTLAVAWSNLGIVEAKQGDLDSAFACFAKARALAPGDGSIDYNQGLASIARGRLDDAILCFETAVSKDPKNALAHNNLGYLFTQKGDRAKAIAHLREAVRADPRLKVAQDNLTSLLRLETESPADSN